MRLPGVDGQVLLASARSTKTSEIAADLGCSVKTVRDAIYAYEQQGLECLSTKSSLPKTVKPILDQVKREQLRQLLQE